MSPPWCNNANGATGVFITTTGEAPGSNVFEIAGDRGKLVLQNDKLTFYRTRTSVSQFLKESKRAFAMPEIWECDIPGGSGDGHKGITQNWVNAILNGTLLLARGEEGINGVTLANAMQLSAWTGEWIDLPIDEDRFYNALQEKIRTSTFQKGAAEDKANDFAGTF